MPGLSTSRTYLAHQGAHDAADDEARDRDQEQQAENHTPQGA